MSKIIEMRRERAAILQKAKHLVDLVDERDGRMTEEETRDYDGFMADAENLGNEIRRRERLEQELGQQEPDAAGQRGHRPMPDPNIGMTNQEVRRYSLVKAIRAASTGNWKDAEFELECSRAMSDHLGMDPQGFFVPYDWVERGGQAAGEQRDLTVGTPTAGGNLVATDLLAGSFIELLRNRMVVQRAGATMLTGLVGDIAIPRQSGAATAYWVGEAGSLTESQQAVDQVPMSPRTIGAFTDFSRKLLIQSSIDVEMFVRSDLALVLALGIDYAALHGDNGTDPNQPDGIEKITGVGAPGNGLASWAGVVGLETEIAAANADVNRMAYVTNALVRGKLKTTEKAANTGIFIWGDGQQPLNGYRAEVSNQVRSNAGAGTNESFLFFGNWGDLMIGLWSGLDVLVDPYTHSTSGTVRVVNLQDVDINVRHPQSFAFEQGTT